MAAPTSTIENKSHFYQQIVASDSDTGTHTYDISHLNFAGAEGWSIQLSALTAAAVTIHASNDGTNFVDVTEDTFGVATLSGSEIYIKDGSFPAKLLRVQLVINNATNSATLTIFAPKQ